MSINDIITQITLIDTIKTLEIAGANYSLIPDFLINQYQEEKQKNKAQITLQYSPTQKVERVWNKSKGKKDFYPKHLINGHWENGLGDRSRWLPYRSEHLMLGEDKWILWHEGEKATDYALSKGVVSTCLVGSGANDHQMILNAIKLIKGLGIEGIIYLADHDQAGINKGKVLQAVAKRLDFPCLLLPIECIFPEANKGDDIVEFLAHNPNLNGPEIIAEIEMAINCFAEPLVKAYLAAGENGEKKKISQWDAIDKAKAILMRNHDEIESHLLLEEVRKQTDITEYSWNHKILKPLTREIKQERLKLEVSLYIAESDLFKRIQLKQKICSRYSLSSSDFKTLINYSEQQQAQPKKTVFSFPEFMNVETCAENWLIPSLLPVGEMLLLTALPKVGKTLFANDLAYAVISGTGVMGEKAFQGKVLYISSDETPRSLTRRFQSRGFDLIPESQSNLRIMTALDLSNLNPLEEQLEDFKPDLVVIDSLTSITLDLGLSEKDAEFARQIYKLKNLLKKYNSASVLIHHDNKSIEAKGICKVSGSARIPAAVWGIAQLSGGDVFDDSENATFKGANLRWLDLQPREGEKVKYELEINPKDCWSESGIFTFRAESNDPRGEKRSQGDMVLNLLRETKQRLEYSEINDRLNLGKSLYVVLDRLCERQLINRARSKNNPRRWVYFVAFDSQQEPNTNFEEKALIPLPPSQSSNSVELNSKTIENKKTEVIQQPIQQISQQTKFVKQQKPMLNSQKQESENNTGLFNKNKPQRGGEVSKQVVQPQYSLWSNCKNITFIENNENQRKEIFHQIEIALICLGCTEKNQQNQKLRSLTGRKPLSGLSNEELLKILELLWEEIGEKH